MGSKLRNLTILLHSNLWQNVYGTIAGDTQRSGCDFFANDSVIIMLATMKLNQILECLAP